MGNGLKRPPTLSGRLKPHDAPSINYDAKPPVFSLQYLTQSHGIDNCSEAQKASILDALHKRGKMTWTQLRMAPRHGLGSETIALTALKVSLPPCVTPDTTILAFRCIGTAPMLGFRDQDRFHIIWIDKSYDCYDHG